MRKNYPGNQSFAWVYRQIHLPPVPPTEIRKIYLCFPRSRFQCITGTHPVERLRECPSDVNDGSPVGIEKCTKSFCGNCCDRRTATMGKRQRDTCFSACRQKDTEARLLVHYFLNLLAECTDVTGVGFSHCHEVRSLMQGYLISCELNVHLHLTFFRK